MKQRIPEIDVLRGLGIVFVLLGHAIIVYPINLHSIPIFQFVFNIVSSVHIYLLFLLAGFCYRKKADYLEYLWGKVKHIMIPYIIFNMVDMVPRALLITFVNRPADFMESIRRILFYGGEYWFLYVLFMIYIIVPFVSSASTGIQEQEIVVFIMALILGVSALFVDMPEILRIDSISRCFVFFYAGFLVKKCWQSCMYLYGTLVNRKKVSAILFGILWIGIVVLAQMTEEAEWIFLIATVVGILFWVQVVGCLKNSPIGNALQKCGQRSLQLYLFNGFLLVISRTLIINVLEIRNPWIIVGANMVFTLGVSMLIIEILSKNKLGRFILGE